MIDPVRGTARVVTDDIIDLYRLLDRTNGVWERFSKGVNDHRLIRDDDVLRKSANKAQNAAGQLMVEIQKRIRVEEDKLKPR